jgi:hypothetical protein
MIEVRTALERIAVPSTELGDVTLRDDGGSVTIRFDYEREESGVVGGFVFGRVRSYRHRAESHCTVWHIDAYDVLTEIENSEWVAELLDATPADMRGNFEMHHYIIYFDGSGCFEVVARSWAALPETPLERS